MQSYQSEITIPREVSINTELLVEILNERDDNNVSHRVFIFFLGIIAGIFLVPIITNITKN
jgi:hypothetical protein